MLGDPIAALRGVKSGPRHMAGGKGPLNSHFIVCSQGLAQWESARDCLYRSSERFEALGAHWQYAHMQACLLLISYQDYHMLL